jgi:hypothetical protein
MFCSLGIIGYGAVGKELYELVKTIDGFTGDDPSIRVHCFLVKDRLNKPDLPGEHFVTEHDFFVTSNGHDVVVDVATYCDEVKDTIIASLANKITLITASKELVSKHWQELVDAAKAGQSRIIFNAIPASAEPCEFDDVELTESNFHEYADKDLYSYRGAGPEITAKYLYKIILNYYEKNRARHMKWLEDNQI